MAIRCMPHRRQLSGWLGMPRSIGECVVTTDGSGSGTSAWVLRAAVVETTSAWTGLALIWVLRVQSGQEWLCGEWRAPQG